MKIKYGMTIRLRHVTTTRLLKSLDKNFPSPSISKQQMVVATNDESDLGTLWRVKAPHGSPETTGEGQPVKNGAIIRLEHVNTRSNLHSHSIKDGHLAPVTRDGAQQEVTAFGALGLGDDNDDWILETQGADTWEFGGQVRLYHRKTNWPLHSHTASEPVTTAGFQEVTAYAGKDPNDFWVAVAVEPADSIRGAAERPSATTMGPSHQTRPLPTTKERRTAATKSQPLAEHFRNHAVVYILSLMAATVVATWQVSKATQVDIAEQKVGLMERQLSAERSAHEQTQAKLKSAEAELTNYAALVKDNKGASKPDAEIFARISAENSALRSEIAQLKTQISEDHAREWPALDDERIAAWAEKLAPHKIKSLTVYWGQDVEAKFFYRSLQKLGVAVKAEVLPGSGNGVRHKIVVTASPQDQAAPLLVRLLNESNYPASLDTGPAIVLGEIGIFLGEKP